MTREAGQGAMFIAVEHCAAECVGGQAAKSGPRVDALEPLRQGGRPALGPCGKAGACGGMLRHDHGSQDMSQVFQEAGAFVGIESSPALVREPQGNACEAQQIGAHLADGSYQTWYKHHLDNSTYLPLIVQTVNKRHQNL